jgi:hypothetical protein
LYLAGSPIEGSLDNQRIFSGAHNVDPDLMEKARPVQRIPECGSEKSKYKIDQAPRYPTDLKTRRHSMRCEALRLMVWRRVRRVRLVVWGFLVVNGIGTV